MKIDYKITIAIVVTLVLVFSTGFFVGKDTHQIVDKQDELSVAFDRMQAELKIEVARFAELQAEAKVLTEMSNDEDIENLVNITTQLTLITEEVNVLYKEILRKRAFLASLKFAYNMLQEMR